MGVVSFSRYIIAIRCEIRPNGMAFLNGYVSSKHKHADLNLQTYMHLMAKLDISESSRRRLCGGNRLLRFPNVCTPLTVYGTVYTNVTVYI